MAIEQRMAGTADITKLSSSSNAMGLIITLLGKLLHANKENQRMIQKVEELEEKINQQDKLLEDLQS